MRSMLASGSVPATAWACPPLSSVAARLPRCHRRPLGPALHITRRMCRCADLRRASPPYSCRALPPLPNLRPWALDLALAGIDMEFSIL